MAPEQVILKRLENAGRARRRAEQAREEAMVEIAALLPAARQAGLTVAEIMGATHLARQTVYDLLDRRAGA